MLPLSRLVSAGALAFLALTNLPVTTAAAAAAAGTLVNPNASPEAKALMSLLMNNKGKNVISGQMSNPQDGASGEWFLEANVLNVIKKAPALGGFDFMNYSPSRIQSGVLGQNYHYNMTQDAISWSKRGGIVAFNWHWGSPTGTKQGLASSNFVATSTTFDLVSALGNQNGNDYKAILSDMKAIADQIGQLQKSNVPILFRPLHEADEGYFWWAYLPGDTAKAAAVKSLYKLMYDQFANTYKLNNIVWVWNAKDPASYPGDSQVDILSYDIYAKDKSDPSPGYSNTYSQLQKVSKNKLIALSECGKIPNPNDLLKTGWSYFMTWSGGFIDPKQNGGQDGSTKADLNDPTYLTGTVYNNPKVLTLDKLGNWQSGSGGNSNNNAATPAKNAAKPGSQKPMSSNNQGASSGGSRKPNGGAITRQRVQRDV